MKKVVVSIVALFLLGQGVCQAYTDAAQAVAAHDYPAAEALVRRHLQDDPGDDEQRFLLARLLAWQERFPEAVHQYDVLLGRSPTHVDYLLGRAQTLFWQGNLSAALQTADRALAVSPAYGELWLVKTKILLAQGESEQAALLIAQAQKHFSGAELENIRRVLVAAQRSDAAFVPRRELEAGFTYEYLSDEYAHWASGFVLGEWFYEPRATLYGQLRLLDRFDENDQELTLGTSQPLGSTGTYQFEASFSPNPDIVAEYSVLGGLTQAIGTAWDVGISARHSLYTDTASTLVSLGGGGYFMDQRLAYTLYVSKVEGASETYSHRVQWSRFYGRRNQVSLYVATGRETENVGEVAGRTRFITTSVFGYGIAGRHWLKEDAFALTYQLWQHDQGSLYTRWGGSLGFRIQF
jgi:YaiO family outer membrane protein